MDLGIKKLVLDIYSKQIENKIQEVKDGIREELKKIDKKEALSKGSSELGDVGGTCSSQNFSNTLIVMKNRQLDYLVSCLNIVDVNSEEADNAVKVLSIVKVKYSNEKEKFTKVFFLVPYFPNHSEIYKDHECEICALSLDTPLAHSLIGATKNSWVTSVFKDVEYDGLVEEVL